MSAALRIYELARIYRATFSLRRATYLFSYAVFSAATILPLHSSPDSDPREKMEIVVFFWNALRDLQNGANFGLRKTIRIIGGMFERAGIDLGALPTSMEKRQQQQQQHVQGGGAEGRSVEFVTDDQSLPNLPDNIGLDVLSNEAFKDFYNDLSVERIDWPAFVDDDAGHENDELLYGLFRSGSRLEEGLLASSAQSPAWYL